MMLLQQFVLYKYILLTKITFTDSALFEMKILVLLSIIYKIYQILEVKGQVKRTTIPRELHMVPTLVCQGPSFFLSVLLIST